MKSLDLAIARCWDNIVPDHLLQAVADVAACDLGMRKLPHDALFRLGVVAGRFEILGWPRANDAPAELREAAFVVFHLEATRGYEPVDPEAKPLIPLHGWALFRWPSDGRASAAPISPCLRTLWFWDHVQGWFERGTAQHPFENRTFDFDPSEWGPRTPDRMPLQWPTPEMWIEPPPKQMREPPPGHDGGPTKPRLY